MRPLVHGFGRASPQCAEREQVIGITPTRNPRNTVRRLQLIKIGIGREVNATTANVADLQLSIAPGCDFSCEVPLPAVGKLRVKRHALGWRTRPKVGQVRVGSRSLKGWAVKRTLCAGSDCERSICANETSAGAADRIAGEKLADAGAQHKFPVTEHVPCETEARSNQVVI